MKKSRRIWRAINKVFICFSFFICMLLLRSSDWFLKSFNEVEFSTVVYQLFSPMKGTGTEIINEYCKSCLYPSLLLSAMFYVAVNVYNSMLKNLILVFNVRIIKKEMHFEINNKVNMFRKMFILGIVFVILLGRMTKQAILIGVPEFIESISNNSELYEQEYIDPQDVALIFPQKKRNLLLIYMESMETLN